MRLLPSQKDALYDLIEQNRLSPSQFEFVESESKRTHGALATNLLFKGSDFFFSFETIANSEMPHFSIYSPGEFAYEETAYPGSWVPQYERVSNWLLFLKREINTPNKWDRLYSEISGIYLKTDNDSSKFTIHEFEDLQNKISNIKSGFQKIGLPSEQLLVFNDKLDYLISQAKEMNKFDWKSLFIGTIISIIIQLAVSPENAKEIWEIVKKTFSNYLLP